MMGRASRQAAKRALLVWLVALVLMAFGLAVNTRGFTAPPHGPPSSWADGERP